MSSALKHDPTTTWTRDDLDKDQKKLLEWHEETFDLRVEITDPKKGILLRRQPYRRVVSQNEGTYYIRDGKFYNDHGQVINRPGGEPTKGEVKK